MSDKELGAQYDPSEVEPRLYEFWLKEKVFEAANDKKGKRFVMISKPLLFQ